MSESREKSEESDSPGRTADELAPVIPARDLFGAGREVWIEHNGERYRLRITRRGKLILQK